MENLPSWLPMAAFIVGVLVVTNVFRIVQRRSVAQKWGGPTSPEEGSTLSNDERTARVMTTWGFTQQDLDANRKGQFSEPQNEKITKTQKSLAGYSAANPIIMLVVAGLVFVGVGGVTYYMLSSSGMNISPVTIAVVGAVIVFVPILIIVSSRLSARQMQDNKDRADDLLNVVGPVKYISGGSSRYGYWRGVEIEGVKFTNSVGGYFAGSDTPGEAKQWAFVEGAQYRIFYTQMKMQGMSYNTLWSAEAV